MLWTAEYPSPVGRLTLACDEARLVGLWLPGQKYYGGGILGEQTSDGADLPVMGQARDWLDRYFAGGLPTPRELPLGPVGSDFRRMIWRLLCDIPYGRTTTYGALARRLGALRGGRATSGRAVGGAVGHNPISIIIPCHRVVGAGGSLTGYAGGLAAKRWLLAHEGYPL